MKYKRKNTQTTYPKGCARTIFLYFFLSPSISAPAPPPLFRTELCYLCSKHWSIRHASDPSENQSHRHRHANAKHTGEPHFRQSSLHGTTRRQSPIGHMGKGNEACLRTDGGINGGGRSSSKQCNGKHVGRVAWDRHMRNKQRENYIKTETMV